MPSIEASILRAQATLDAQTAIAATWVWDEKTVVQWNDALTAINDKKVTTAGLEADSLAKRATYQDTIDQLHDLTVEGLGMARVKWRKDVAKKAILSNLSASGGGRETIQAEALAWVSVWEQFDPTWKPSPANTVAAFHTLIASSDTQEDLYKKAQTVWRTSAEELQVAASALWDDCVAWYEAATVLFKAGTAIGDMVRGNIPVSPTTPEPTPVEINDVTAVAGGKAAVTYVAGGGAHATTTMLQWKITGVDADFTHDTPVHAAGQTVTTGGAAGQEVELRVRTSNSSGTTYGAVKNVTLI